MLDRLLPRPLDANYDGPRLAYWLLGFLVLSKGFMGLNCVFNGRYVATHADGIPLHAYDPAGAGAVLSFFALWGLSQVTLALLGTLTLVRYRAGVRHVRVVCLRAPGPQGDFLDAPHRQGRKPVGNLREPGAARRDARGAGVVAEPPLAPLTGIGGVRSPRLDEAQTPPGAPPLTPPRSRRASPPGP